MHHRLTRALARRRRDRDARGAIAIIVALTMTALLVVAGMVLDFGLVRVDRQLDKSAADSATLAGLHALNLSGDGSSHPAVGVCTAERFLRASDVRFSTVASAAGTWKDGNGAGVANGCTDATLRNKICVPGNKATWVQFTQTLSYQGQPLVVTVQSGYSLNPPPRTAAGALVWPEDGLTAAAAFQDDSFQGCDQLAVVITQSRKPGFGSLATTADLVSSIRSVGRVKQTQGGSAPAMLLLKRTGCPVLSGGSSAGTSHIYVFGAVSSNGRTQPGTIHADSDGSGCSGGSNANIFLGKGQNGIVAFAAPLATNPAVADSTKPGSVTSYAALNGASSSVVSDGTANTFGSGSVDAAGIGAAAKSAPTGRGLVTRKPVDDRYLTGVRGMVTASQPIWALTAANAAASGYSVVSSCSPATVPNVAKVFVDCTANNGFTGPVTFGASTTTVVFNGVVNPSGSVSIPSATKVYIFGAATKNAINLGNGATFSVHTSGNLSGVPSQCANTQATTATDKAVVVVKSGMLKETGAGALLQMCYTTMLLLGNQASTGCLPATSGTAPTTTPCGGAAGDAQLMQNGGGVDWTAPNYLDLTTDITGSATPAATAAWADTSGPEDLAFWSESYGGASNPNYTMAGGGTFHVVGVYMAPNADPFTLSGGATQTLNNAQYIASSIALSGSNASISMKVDPNAAVTLPTLGLVGLVR